MILFSQTILYVKDVIKSMEFYKQAFGLEERFIHETKGYGEIESDTIALAFAKRSFVKSHLDQPYEESTLETLPPPFELAFITEDVEKTFERAVGAGARVVHAPTEKPWGQTVAYVRDIDGFLIEIGSKIET